MSYSEQESWRYSSTVLKCLVVSAITLDSTLNALTIPFLPRIVHYEGTMTPNSSLNKITENSLFFEAFPYYLFHESPIYEGSSVGFLVAVKAAVQLYFHPLLKNVTYQHGFSLIMLMGIVALFFASFLIAITQNFYIITLSRMLHGIASSCIRIAGIEILTDEISSNEKINAVSSFELFGTALGLVLGPLYGGVLYDLIGKPSVFLFLCLCLFIQSFLQLISVRPDRNYRQSSCGNFDIRSFFIDSNLLIITTSLFVVHSVFAGMETALPLQLNKFINTSSWKMGIVFFTTSIAYIFGRLIFSWTKNMNNWFIADIGIFSLGISQSAIFMAHGISNLIIPMTLAGFGKSMVDNTLMPKLLDNLKERNFAIFHNIVIINDLVISLSYIIGPLIGGIVMSTLSFSSLMILFTCVCLVTVPIIFYSRNILNTKKNPEREHLIKSNYFQPKSSESL